MATGDPKIPGVPPPNNEPLDPQRQKALDALMGAQKAPAVPEEPPAQPPQPAAERKPLTPEELARFDAPEFDEEKRKHDPLHKFARETLGVEPERFRFRYCTVKAVKKDTDGKITSGVFIDFDNYHDFRTYRDSLTPEQKAEFDSTAWEEGWQRAGIFASGFWDQVDKPEGKFFKSKDQIYALYRQAAKEQLPDEYEEAVEHGEIELPKAERKPLTPEKLAKFEGPQYEAEKKKRDLLYRFVKDVLGEDPKQFNFKYRTVKSVKPDPKRQGGHLGDFIDFSNYHDFLAYRNSLSPEQKAKFDSLSWQGGWSGSTVLATNFWNHVNKPEGKFFKFKDQIYALYDQATQELYPDKYEEAVERGEIPEIKTGLGAWWEKFRGKGKAKPEAKPADEKPIAKEEPPLPAEAKKKKGKKAEKQGKTAEKKEAKKAEAKPEREKTPEEKDLDLKRRAYVEAQIAAEKHAKQFTTSEKLTPELRQVQENLNRTQKEYFDARREVISGKMGVIETEIDARIAKGETVVKDTELKRFVGEALFQEFKEVYDAKTQIKAETKKDNKVLDVWRRMGNWYQKQPLQRKLEVSALLFAGGFVAGQAMILAGAITAGKLTQRMLASGATFVGLEAVMKKWEGRSLGKRLEEEREVMKDFAQSGFEHKAGLSTAESLKDFFNQHDAKLDTKFAERTKSVERSNKWYAARRYLVAGGASALVASGLTGKAFQYLADKLGIHPLEMMGIATREDLPKGLQPSPAAEAHGGAPPAEMPEPKTEELPLSHIRTPEELVAQPDVAAPEVMPPAEELTPPKLEELPLSRIRIPAGLATQPEVMPPPAEPAAAEAIAPETPSATAAAEALTEKIAEKIEPGTIVKSGNVWQAARSLVESGKITPEQFNKAWGSSMIEINGKQVPIYDVGLSHPGDTVTFVEDPAGGGHFEIKPESGVKLGTAADLEALKPKPAIPLETPAEISPTSEELPLSSIRTPEIPQPEVLGLEAPAETATPPEVIPEQAVSPEPAVVDPELQATVQAEISSHPNFNDQVIMLESYEKRVHPNIFDRVFADRTELRQHIAEQLNHFKALEQGVIADQTGKFKSLSLFDQEQGLKFLRDRMEAKPKAIPFLGKLYQALEHSTAHQKALESYDALWKSSGLTTEEWKAVKDMKLGLQKNTLVVELDPRKINPEEIVRALPSILKTVSQWATAEVMNKLGAAPTVDEALQHLAKPK